MNEAIACEGSGAQATTADENGTPLCAPCLATLAEECATADLPSGHAPRTDGASMKNVVTVTVSGPVGVGKSAIYGEIEIALRAVGVMVQHADPVAAQSEKNLTDADWAHWLDLYQPIVVLREVVQP